MKITKLKRIGYYFGAPIMFGSVIPTGRWKIEIINGEDTLYLEVKSELNNTSWESEDHLVVVTTEEFINDCSSRC